MSVSLFFNEFGKYIENRYIKLTGKLEKKNPSCLQCQSTSRTGSKFSLVTKSLKTLVTAIKKTNCNKLTTLYFKILSKSI